jgi:2-oxoisovalerate dehydrogenase E1 component beta subunit
MQMTYLEAIADAMRVEMRRDERVFLIGEDIGTYGGAFKLTKGFLDEFGASRVIDAPISEAAIIGAAIGASLNGMRPVAEMQFMDFVTNGFNQIVTVAGTTAYRWGARTIRRGRRCKPVSQPQFRGMVRSRNRNQSGVPGISG